jgi:hypothetical protein
VNTTPTVTVQVAAVPRPGQERAAPGSLLHYGGFAPPRYFHGDNKVNEWQYFDTDGTLSKIEYYTQYGRLKKVRNEKLIRIA